jgi:uncharacterized protein YndB with AHSA1/START domain
MMLNTPPTFAFLVIALMMASLFGAAVLQDAKGPSTLLQATRIEAEITVDAAIDEVWSCWTTSEGAQTFFAPKCEIDPVPGGSFEIWFMPGNPPGERGAEDLKVLSVLPGEMLSFEWSAPPQFAHARPKRTWVVVTFHVIDDSHTRVRLVHLGWDEMKAKHPDHRSEWDQVRDYFAQAWPHVLNNLKRRFDEGPRWDADGREIWKS